MSSSDFHKNFLTKYIDKKHVIKCVQYIFHFASLLASIWVDARISQSWTSVL